MSKTCRHFSINCETNLNNLLVEFKTFTCFNQIIFEVKGLYPRKKILYSKLLDKFPFNFCFA